jgi:hypothetical protein
MQSQIFQTFVVLSAISTSILAVPFRPNDDTVGGLKIGPSIVEVSPSFRNVFPAKNFNRNVSVPWSETEIFEERKVPSTTSMLSPLEDAKFIVFSKDFYKVCSLF